MSWISSYNVMLGGFAYQMGAWVINSYCDMTSVDEMCDKSSYWDVAGRVVLTDVLRVAVLKILASNPNRRTPLMPKSVHLVPHVGLIITKVAAVVFASSFTTPNLLTKGIIGFWKIYPLGAAIANMVVYSLLSKNLAMAFAIPSAALAWYFHPMNNKAKIDIELTKKDQCNTSQSCYHYLDLSIKFLTLVSVVYDVARRGSHW